jgi:hypothetical protein
LPSSGLGGFQLLFRKKSDSLELMAVGLVPGFRRTSGYSWLQECMSIRRASRYLREAVAVNPILAISNGISGLAAPTFVVQVAASQPGPGGFASEFASTFAAARGVAGASENVAGGLETSDGSSDGTSVATTADAEEVSTQHASLPSAGNSQLRKLLNSSALGMASAMAAVNVVIPGFTSAAAAARIPSSQPQTSLSQASFPQTSSLETSVAPALTAIAQAEVRDDVAGTIQTSARTTAYDAAVQSSAVGAIFDSGAGQGGAAGNLTSRSALDMSSGMLPGVLIANRSGEASRRGNPVAGTTTTEWTASGSQNELVGSNAAGKTEGSLVTAPATTTGQSASFTGASISSLGVIKNDEENLSLPSGRGFGSVQPGLPGNQTVAPTSPAPTELTNAKAESQSAGVDLLASADFLTGRANAEYVGTPDAAVQSDAPAQTGAGDPLLAAVNSDGENLASPILNPLLQLTPAAAAVGLAGARADAVPAAGVRGQGAGGRSSILDSLTAAAGSDSREAGPMANQTPFSIFFSGSASGTESAASTLPRMILPETSSAIRGSHSNGAEASGANAQANFSSGASQSGTSRSGASQNVAPSNTALSSSAPSNGAASNTIRPGNKDSLSGSESGSPAVGQISRRDADLQAAGAQLAASQTGTAPAPAPATSPAATLPLAGPATATAVADPQSKPGTLTEAAPTSPASPVPATAEMPAAAAPGQVQLAQMISRAEQSEMRIGMNTSAFGSVEVRAVVHSSDVGLVIGSERGDLRSLMASDMPAITNTLQQQSLRLNSVNFMQGFAFSNNASGGGDSQQRTFVPPVAYAGSASSEAAVDDSAEPLAAGEFGGGTRGLSILA